MSSVVAVAGGTGGLGRAIVEAIVADGKFQVLVLARKVNKEKEQEIGARILPVNYADVDGLTRVLEENKVHTVIATMYGPGAAEADLSLISAADRAASTKRYIPSFWGYDYIKETTEEFFHGYEKLAVAEALTHTNLEYTAWLIGCFADYYVAPSIKSHLAILNVVVDVANNAAAIPVSGDVPVSFTHSFDVARFVAASLTLPKWEPKTYLVGEKLTWHQLVELAQDIKGTKFEVTYDSEDDLKSGKVTELPSHPALYPSFPKQDVQALLATVGRMASLGIFDIKAGHPIVQDFPDLHLRTMKELLVEAWGKGKR